MTGRVLILIALSLTAAFDAHAAVDATVTFTPDVVAPHLVSTLRIVVSNTDPEDATALTVSKTLPSGVAVAPLPNLVNTCGGAVDIASGGATVGLVGGEIPGATPDGPGRCEIAFNVRAPVPGAFTAVLKAGAVTSSRGSLLVDVPASLTCNPHLPILGTKTFSPDVMHGDPSSDRGTSRVTITLTNPNDFTLHDLEFTDHLPPGLRVGDPPNASTSCRDAHIHDPESGDTSITLHDGRLSGGESCSVRFDVAVDRTLSRFFRDEVLVNTIPAGAISTDEWGVTNATISGEVRIQTGARVIKTIEPATIASGDAATLTLEFRNYNADALTSIDLVDILPPPMRIASPAHADDNCGILSQVDADPGHGHFSIERGRVEKAPNGRGYSSCRVSVSVTADTASDLELTNHVLPHVFGGVITGPASATLRVRAPDNISATKVFTGTAVQSGLLTLTIRLKNAAPRAALNTSLVDDLTTMGAGYSVAASPAATTTCGGTLLAPPTATTIALNNGIIPAGGTCTVTVPVRIAATAVPGTRTNTIVAGAIQSSQGDTTEAVVASVTTVAALGVSKAFSPTAVVAGQASRLTITLTHADGAAPFTNLSFTDTLPTGHVVATPPGTTSTCGGTVTAATGTGTVSLAGGTLGAGPTTCSVALNVTTPAGGGSATNTLPAGAVTTAQGVINGKPASATLVRIPAEVVITKSFTPPSILNGGTSTVAVNIANPSVLDLSGGTLFDLLPLGLVGAFPPFASFSGAGCAGVVTAVAGDQVVSLVDATIAKGSECVLRVNVTASRGGRITNTIPAGAFHTAQGVTNVTAATAVLTVAASADLAIAKTLLDPVAVPGTVVTYEVTVSNAGPNGVAGATVADPAPAGTKFIGWTCAPSDGAECTPAGTGDVLDTVTIPAGGSVRYVVSVAIDSGLTGSLANTASIAAPAPLVDPVPGNNASTVTVPLVPTVDLRGSKSDLTHEYTPGATQTYFVVVSNAGPSDAASVTVADTLPAGVTLAGNVTCTPAGQATCGAVSGAAGGSSFGAVGARIPAGAPNRLTFTVPVAFASDLVTDPLTNTVTAADVTPGVSTAPIARSDTNARAAEVTLSLTVTDGSATYTPGGTATFTVTVTSTSLSDALDLTVGDALPAGVTVNGPVICVASGGATCGTVGGAAGDTGFGIAGATLDAGPGNSLVLTVPVAFAASLATNPLVVTATANDLASGATANGSDSDTRSLDVTLALTKTDTRPAYTPGGSAIYRLVLQNTGISDALDVSLVDTLPSGVTLIAPPGCVPGPTSSCGTVTGAAGGSSFGTTGARVGGNETLVFLAAVNFASGLLTDPLINSATATDAVSGSVASGSDTNARLPTVATADLSMVKTGGGSVSFGGTINYLLTIANNGPDAAGGASFVDVVPASVTAVAATCTLPSGGAVCGPVNVNGNEVTGTVSTLPAGGTVAISVTGIASVTGTFVNHATITTPAGVADTNQLNNTGSVSTTVGAAPDLTVSKTHTGNFLPGQVGATYTVAVTNLGPSPTVGTVTITDTIPIGLSATATAGSGWTCTVTSDGLRGVAATCTRSNALAPTASYPPVTVTVNVAPDAGPTVTNVVTVSGGGDTTPGNNTASDPTTITRLPDLTVSKTHAGSFTVGQTGATYTVMVTNVGPGPTVGVVTVTDTIPAGLTATALAGTGWTCTVTPARCTRADALAPGASYPPIIVTVNVASTAGATVANVVEVSGGGDTSPANNTATDPTAITQLPDLTVSKSHAADFTTGQTGAIYTIIVTNAGAGNTAGVVTVTDTVPTGLTATALGGPGWACTLTPARCTRGDVLGPGLSYPPITLTVNVAGNAGPTVTNVVTVSGGGDTSAGNNTASDPTAIAVVDPAFIDLTVTKAHENLTVGQTGVTYTVTVTNVGTAATVGTVIVTDEIPAGLTATALSGPGWACAVTPARCTRSDPLAPGASYPPITVTVTVDAGAGPTVTNVVTVSGGGDTITGNNTASDPTAISSVPIPLLSPAGLVVLVALLVLAGATSLRARQRARVVADEAGRR